LLKIPHGAVEPELFSETFNLPGNAESGISLKLRNPFFVRIMFMPLLADDNPGRKTISPLVLVDWIIADPGETEGPFVGFEVK
jgi:hypothetical protein